MKKIVSITMAMMLCAVMMFSTVLTASAKFDQTAKPKAGDTVAILHTNYGDIAMSFFEKYAPKGVENFTKLAKDGKYKDTIFHRVIDKFMIQGGDYTNFNGTGGESCWGEPFELECVDELGNIRGAVSYANSGPDTNGSQFFINSVDNAYLNGSYTVFGQVFAGMDVVDLISKCKKSVGGDGAESSPVNEVKLLDVEVTKYKANMEKSLTEAVDPYKGISSDNNEDATEVTTAGAENVEGVETSADKPFDFTPIIIIGVIIVVIGGILAAYAIYDNKQRKKRAAEKAAKMANKKKKKK